jgi:hypothetical protein
MTGTNCDLFTHKSSRSYLNHLVFNKPSYKLMLNLELKQEIALLYFILCKKYLIVIYKYSCLT